MKNLILYMALILFFSPSCNKYKEVEKKKISGYAQLHDPLQNSFAVPFAKQPIYLSKSSDTINYLFQASSDEAGRFVFSYLGTDNMIIHARMIRDGVEYYGKTEVTPAKATSGASFNLDLYPVYANGLSLDFKIGTSTSGSLANFAFRLYASKLAAQTDSVKYAYVNEKTSGGGVYSKYNLIPAKYYIVAKESFAGITYLSLDSVEIGQKGKIYKTTILKQASL